jgi:hypothetical protein
LIFDVVCKQIKGSILMGIVVVTGVVWWLQGDAPTQIANVPSFKFGIVSGPIRHPTDDSLHFITLLRASTFIVCQPLRAAMHGVPPLALTLPH